MDIKSFHHNSKAKTGVLIVNLGTPDAPDTKSVRRYLKEFLWDPRVVEVPRPIWWFVLNFIILNTRPRKSAKAYQKVWTEDGSPLMSISKEQTAAISESLKAAFGDEVVVDLAMRYGSPSIGSVLKGMQERGVRELLIVPMYPQYSATTTASIFDEVTDQLKRWRWLPELRFINHYHDNPDYIEALANSVESWRAEHGGADKLLMSFHGVPEEYFHKGDPYHCECHRTGRLLAERLGLKEGEWQISFQSRLGPKQWLSPYTDQTLEKLGEEGVKSVQVICPGFAADCLETIEEIGMENRDTFLEAGGERYEYIACLNAQPNHISMLSSLIQKHLGGWVSHTQDPEETLAHAKKLGATQ